jgi:hypothetical protein
MVTSSSAITQMSAAAQMPYATVERTTRPLKEADRWVSRGNTELRPVHLASLIASFAAPLPSDALKAVETVEGLGYASFGDLEPGRLAPPGAICGRDNAIFPWFGVEDHTLFNYLVSVIVALTEMTPERRETVTSELTDAGWTLTLCLKPSFGVIYWHEADDAQPGSRKRVAINWHPRQGSLASDSVDARGVMRVAMIPFQVLVTAAEICSKAKRHHVIKPFELTKPASGGAGEGDTTPENVTAAEAPTSTTVDNRQPASQPAAHPHSEQLTEEHCPLQCSISSPRAIA